MIKGIGTDIVEVERVERAIQKEAFIKRVYTTAEIEYCSKRGMQAKQSYAARFAGKEAVLKAFGTGLRNGTLLDIEILPDELGCPQVKLTGYFASLAEEKNIQHIYISLSHTKTYATAQCVMEEC